MVWSNRKACAWFVWLLLTPVVAFAQTDATLGDILDTIAGLLRIFVPVIVGLAMLVFLWGAGMSIFKSGDARAQPQAKSLMVWGIVGLFVMLSVWGIVTVLAQTFSLTIGGEGIPPEL